MTTISRPRARHTQQEHAQAFAVVLRKEFGIRFRLYDTGSGQLIDATSPHDDGDSVKALVPDVAPALRSPHEVRERAEEGQTRVRAYGSGLYDLSVVLYEGGRPTLFAAGVYPGLAQTPVDAAREFNGLSHWLQSFSDRLRFSDQFACQHAQAEEQSSQARVAWEGLLSLDHAVRRLRIHRDPTTNQQRVLETANMVLGAQAIICVPPDPQLPVVMHGEPLIGALDCVQLAGLVAKTPAYSGSGPVFCNQAETEIWAMSFPCVSTLLALPIGDPPTPGWVIAINKGGKDHRTAAHTGRPPRPFRKSDAALLTPFVSLLRLHHSAAARYQDLKELVVGLARSLTAAIDAKDSYTFGHSERVARIAVELGRTMGMDGDALSDLYLAGLLHDVGKIGVPDALLRKTDKLTDEEYTVVKEHVTIGYTILSELRPIRHLLCGVLYHHERYDGRGYPEGLAGEAIPQLARVLAVADAYDAMSTTRPYRTAKSVEDVEEQIRQGAGQQWDAQVVDALLRCRQKVHAIRQRGVGESLRHALDAAMRDKEPSTRVF
jgi:HD-GYP domain-containing protein (c-di-GMP phosphodiesterase class II)